MDLLSYGTALVLIAAAPGPVVTILLARTLSGDVRGAVAFATGVVVGKLVIMVALAGGLILWLQDSDGVLAAMKSLGVIYLGWMALRLWHGIEAGACEIRANSPARGAADMAAGLATSLSSPFSLLLFLSMIPVVSRGTHGTGVPFLMLAAVTAAASGAVFAGYILSARLLQETLNRPHLSRSLHRSMAALLGCSTIWLAFG